MMKYGFVSMIWKRRSGYRFWIYSVLKWKDHILQDTCANNKMNPHISLPIGPESGFYSEIFLIVSRSAAVDLGGGDAVRCTARV